MVSRKEALTEGNRKRQRVYREKHGKDLRKARRVASALMAFRGHEGFDSRKLWRMNAIMEKLEDFFTADEMRLFVTTAKLTPAQRRARAESPLKAVEEKIRKAVR